MPAEQPAHHDGEPAVSTAPTRELTIVGIGASAGGLVALKKLFARMPPDPGVAFVVVMHLAPERESHLAELLQPHCPMPVQQVTGDVELEADHVYIIPPGANLNTIDTHLRLTKLEERRQERAPIDHFFRTLAETHDGHAIGIIITGTGSDGTLGLRRIKEMGGVAIAQSLDEAEYDGMPRNAILSGMVDLILPLEKIAEQVIRIARTKPRLPIELPEKPAPESDEPILQRIFSQVRARTGHDFSRYKRTTVMRRIRRRMQLQQVEHLEDYLDVLRQDRDEIQRLFEDMLITVTEFFRDRPVYEAIEHHVVPRLLEGRGVGDRVRAWSVGCSTGEEAYSLAMLIMEGMAKRDCWPLVQLFASDLHQSSLKLAREGLYPDSIASDVSPERLQRFFVREDSSYRIRKEVRDLVIFAPHNLLKDPPFSHLDLILCRNLLIYLQRDVQQEVLALFHYALKQEGMLVLGSSESIDDSELFHCEDKAACLFRRRNVHTREPHLPVFSLSRTPRLDGGTEGERAGPADSYGALHARMVEQYAPPSVLVSQRHDIVHYSANAGSYLQMPGGEPTSNVFKLVREPLRVELRAALHAARESGRPAQGRPVDMVIGGEQRRVLVRAQATEDPSLQGFVLVMFDEVEQLDRRTAAPLDEQQANAVRELENELEFNRKRLEALIEEYETSQEEMQASNEELQSANEELRSTLEELETSKEELQSMNEELATVNQENRHRVEELSQLTGDLQYLLTATEIATIFLDRHLRIVRFTPQVEDLFNIRISDRGRPLSDLTHRLGDTELPAVAQRVLTKLVPVEREVVSENGRAYLMRVLPYRAADERIDGVVITLIDITDRKESEEALRASEERFRSIVSQTTVGIAQVDAAGRFTYVNDRYCGLTGRTCDELVSGTRLHDVIHNEDIAGGDPLQRVLETGGPCIVEGRYSRPDGTVVWVLNNVTPIRDAAGQVTGAINACIDITERKRHEEQMQFVMAELNHRVRNTLAVVESTAEQTLRHSSDPSEFAKTFGERLRALSKAHSLLTRSEWRGANLRELLMVELGSRAQGRDGLHLEGPELMIRPNATMALHMVIHELSTNAAKYGAWCAPEGAVRVQWELLEEAKGKQLVIRWVEQGGPPVAEPQREGFGSKVINRTVQFELQGETEVRYDPEGLCCTLRIPWTPSIGYRIEEENGEGDGGHD